MPPVLIGKNLFEFGKIVIVPVKLPECTACLGSCFLGAVSLECGIDGCDIFHVMYAGFFPSQ